MTLVVVLFLFGSPIPGSVIAMKCNLPAYAGALLGRPFEDVGRISPEQWTATYGPFGEDGKPMALDDLPTTRAIRDGRPAHASFRIRSAAGSEREIASSAFPIVASEEGSSGAMVLFWPTDEQEGGSA